MATIIKIKRSSGTTTPNLGQGELGYSWGTSAYTDAQSATVTSHGKMFLGTGTETGGIAANIEVIGGKYFTDMLDHGHGTLTANSALVVDSAKKINEFYVDNLGLDGNTILSTNTDGDINLDPNGAGEVVIPDDTYLTFGTSKDTKIKYDEATDDRLEVTGADWNFANGVAISISDTTASSSSITGALTVAGGVGIGENLYVAGSIFAGSLATPANFTVSGDLTVQGGDINITEVATNFNIKDNTSDALVIKEGANQYLNITTTNGSELVTFSTANVVIDNDLQIKGGDLTTNQTTFNLLNSTATTVNAFGAATTLEIGAATGTTNINNNLDVDGDLNIDGGDLTVSTTTFNLANTTATTVNAFGAATTVNIADTGTAARAIDIATTATAGTSALTFGGAISGNTFKINSTASGTVNLTSDVTTGIVNAYTAVTTGTINLATGGASTTNIGGAAATVNIGTTGGNSILEVRGNATTGTATIRTNTGVTTANIFDTVATTGNLFGAATTVAIANTGTGARTVNVATAATAGASTLNFGGAVTGNTLEINSVAAGTVNISSDVTTGTVNLFAGVTTGTVNIATGGASTTVFGGTTGNSTISIRGNGTSGTAAITSNVTTGTANIFTGVTGTINYGGSSTTHDFGNLRIQGNTISTDVVGSTQLIIDPFPTGGDSAGEVVIRGNLTVAGTTTTVNSTEMSVNDPIFTIGDSVTTKMITANASSAATLLTIDSPTGVVETSSITGSNIPNGTTITNVRTRFYTNAQIAGTQTAGTTVIYTFNTSTTTYEAIGLFVSKGANFLEIDLNSNISLREDNYYIGLELRDANTGTPNSAVIARDPANNKVFTAGAILTISAGLSSGITAPQEVTISQGADDNMDRGIQFKYYNTTLKTGFFGYDTSGIVEDVTNYYFTYIPDSTNTNSTFAGTVGSAYFKTVKVDDGVTNGIAFFDAYKRITTTVAAGTADVTTSNQILTVNGSGVPVWTTTLDGGTY